jgi:hypothetical protein
LIPTASSPVSKLSSTPSVLDSGSVSSKSNICSSSVESDSPLSPQTSHESSGYSSQDSLEGMLLMSTIFLKGYAGRRSSFSNVCIISTHGTVGRVF